MDEENVNVVPFKIVPKEEPEVESDETPIKNVLEGLEKVIGKLDNLTVIGSSHQGHFYFASTTGDARQLVYDLESAKNIAMEYGAQHREAEELE